MTYVDRERVLELIANIMQDCKVTHKHRALNQNIKQIPTTDVVEVVRCKDCVYCCISTDLKTNISIQKCVYVGFNPVQSSQVSDDFYCSYGERKMKSNENKL